MKKLLLVGVAGLFLCGCGQATKESGFWDHSTMYKNWDHLKYSWFGFKNPTPETGLKSEEQNWWGIPVEEKQ
ncbi:MAG: hypothetical protein U5R49_25005 [Deltaproteobacteria bacterium]|nr:hypothetical protein [Deltaproteobacteria bacterium]